MNISSQPIAGQLSCPVTPPAKLTSPLVHAQQLHRALLCQTLCDARLQRVSLVRAPAGFGKSTLMKQAYNALQSEGVAVSWLNLDSADNDVSRMLHFLLQALQRLDGQQWDIDNSDSSGVLALALLERVAQIPAPFVIFIDDLEVLQNPVALALIRQLIEQLPVGARLIAGSRALPDIGLSRLRGRGELLEIDSLSLRFSVAETELFIQQIGKLSLPKADILRLHETTEGWVVALRLALLTLDRCDDRRVMIDGFSGSNAVVSDYLSEEVLAQQPERLRDFMLRTSLLPQLSASLCDAIRGENDSQDILEELERENLFLVSLDNEREWFRYHRLFAVFLRTQLERKFPTEIPGLHREAANWYLQQERVVPAIEHALQSGDMAFALPLFARYAESLLGKGRARLLARLLDTVASEQLQQWPRLQVVHVWSLAFTRGAVDAMALLSRYEKLSKSDGEMATHTMALRPMLLSIMDRHDEAYEYAAACIENLPEGFTFPHAILRTSFAYVALVMGKYGQSQSLLDEGRCLKVVDSSPFTMIFAQCVEGAIDMLHGRLRQATTRFRLATSVEGQSNSFATNGNAMAGILFADALYESGKMMEAERLLQVYVPLMQEQAIPDHLICGHRNLSRILYKRGDIDGAMQTITELEYFGYRNELPRLVASARLERARIALLEGDKDNSREECQRASLLGDWEKFSRWSLFGSDIDTPKIALLRWQIHFGSAETAVTQLKKLVEEAETSKRIRRALKLRVLLAIALYRSGNDKSALRLYRKVLLVAVAEGYVQIILDEGEIAVELLQRLAGSQHPGFCEADLANPKKLFVQLVKGAASERTFVPVVASIEGEMFEPLTCKESQILPYLAEGLSNIAIGSRLFVSENTIRTHLRNINAKLHTQSRTEAVAVARRVGLIK